MTKIDICDTQRNNLIAAALGLQHCSATASCVIPLPGTKQYILIGDSDALTQLLKAEQPLNLPDPAPLALRTLGGLMANVLYNLAQRPGDKLAACAADLRRQRDEAVRVDKQAVLGAIADFGQQQEAAETRAALVDVLKAIRPTFGAMGSRDVDVAAQQKLVDRAIELLSPQAQPAAAPAAAGDLMAIDCPACEKGAACDECSGQGKIIVSRSDMAALATEHDHSEGSHHD